METITWGDLNKIDKTQWNIYKYEDDGFLFNSYMRFSPVIWGFQKTYFDCGDPTINLYNHSDRYPISVIIKSFNKSLQSRVPNIV